MIFGDRIWRRSHIAASGKFYLTGVARLQAFCGEKYGASVEEMLGRMLSGFDVYVFLDSFASSTEEFNRTLR